MDLSKIRELLKIVSESGVAEVEIEEDDFKLIVRRNTPNVSIQSSLPIPQVQPSPYYPPPPPQPTFFPQAYPPPPQAIQPPPVPAVSNHAPVVPTPIAEEKPKAETSAVPDSSSNDHTIKAPIVGTFYEAPSPDADPFVSIGDRVKKGDVLCIIEAMKLMNEIESEVSGTIKGILIKNSEPVEYDQPLFIIEED